MVISNFNINTSISEYLTYCDIINKKNSTNIYDLNLICGIKFYVRLNLKKNFDKDSLIFSYLITFLLTNLFPEIVIKQKDFSLETQEKFYMFFVYIKSKQEIHKFLTRFFLDLIPKINQQVNFDKNLDFFIKIPVSAFKELDTFVNIKEFNFIHEIEISIEFCTKNKQKLNKQNNIYKLIPLFWING